MSMAKEIAAIADECESKGQPLTEDLAIEACRDAIRFPGLHRHIWGASRDTLLTEARRARMRAVIMRVRVTTDAGDRVRTIMHVRGTKGYLPVRQVSTVIDLAAMKLRELATDLRAAELRYQAFRRMLPVDVAGDIGAAISDAATKVEHAAEKAAPKPIDAPADATA